jgi:aspartate/methionine/tyrosine aminotransferase
MIASPPASTAVEPVAAATVASRTRPVVLARPHDPTGAAIDGPTLEAIADVVDRAGGHVLSDEVYLDALADALDAVPRREFVHR